MDVFEDMTNIALLCLTMGVGVLGLVVVLMAYIAALAIWEDME
jgi:hypothetical protein